MREKRQLDISYSNEEFVSVFVGVCKSREVLEEYIEKDYEMFFDEYIGFELGVDFGINTYDEDYLVVIFNDFRTKDIKTVFKEAYVFNVKELEAMYPDGLDRLYNTVIVFGGLKYEGEIQEVNNEYGYFKFLGTFKR